MQADKGLSTGQNLRHHSRESKVARRHLPEPEMFVLATAGASLSNSYLCESVYTGLSILECLCKSIAKIDNTEADALLACSSGIRLELSRIYYKNPSRNFIRNLSVS